MQKTNSGAEARAEIEKIEAIKKRAARQAAKRELAPQTHPTVECTVLPMGDGKISMGEHVAGLGTAHFEEGETFSTDLPIALALYERGYVNFPNARETLKAAQQERADEAALEASRSEKLRRLLESA